MSPSSHASQTPLVPPSAPAATSDREALEKHQRRLKRPFWRQPLTLLGISILAFWAVVAIAAPVLAPYGPLEQIFPRYQPPSSESWFGTDQLGRDVLSRIIWGTRLSIPYAMALVMFSVTIGAVLGGIAGYAGGWVDEVIMRFTDMVMSFPTIILALAVAAALGPGLTNAVIAIAFVHWPVFARVVRSYVLSLRQQDYVSAARLLGSSTSRTLFRDIVPNVAGPVAVLVMLETGTAILLLSGLSFLGLGAQPPAAEWGQMVAEGARVLDRWWIGTFSGLAILTVVLALNLVGDTLRDFVDPRVG